MFDTLSKYKDFMISKKNFLTWLLITSSVLNLGASKIEIANSAASLGVNSNGGGIIKFTLNNDTVNPFTWKLSQEQMPMNNRNGAPFEGHFICLGRWGNPTEGEIRAGIPNNGQIGNMLWNVINQTDRELEFSVNSDLDLMSLNRRIFLDDREPVFLVKDSVTNQSTLGRLFNIVQHATLGSPFLNSGTLIDTNASVGFMQDNWKPNPESHSFAWPVGISANNDSVINLRKSNGLESYVATHLIKDSIGWITAYSPQHKLLLGYIWQTKDYPWINVWHQTENKIPVAKGIEFGTTGIGAPYQELLNNTSFYGVDSFMFFDALESFQKKFLCFLIPINEPLDGIESIELKEGTLELYPYSNDETKQKKEPLFIQSKLVNEL